MKGRRRRDIIGFDVGNIDPLHEAIAIAWEYSVEAVAAVAEAD